MAVDWSKIISLAGPALANMAQAKTNNRAYENNTNIVTARDAEQAAIDRAKLGQTQQELELRAAADARIAQNEAYAKSLHSAALMGAKDASFDRSGFKGPVADISFSGGLRPSMFGAAGQDAAGQVNRAAMQELMKPPSTGKSSTGKSSTEAVSRYAEGSVPGYEAPTTEGAGFWERALGIAGFGATIAGELMKARGVGVNGPAGTPQPPATAAPRPGAPSIPSTSGGNLPGILGPGGVSVGFGTPPEGGGLTTSPFGSRSGSGMLGSQYTVPSRRALPPSPTPSPEFLGTLMTAQREQFAKRMGYRSLQELNSALSSLGPQGQELSRANVASDLTQWMQQVETMLGRR